MGRFAVTALVFVALLCSCARSPEITRSPPVVTRDWGRLLSSSLHYEGDAAHAVYATGGRLGFYEMPGEWETGISHAVWQSDSGSIECFDGLIQAGVVNRQDGSLQFLLPGPEAEKTLICTPWGYESKTISEDFALRSRVRLTNPNEVLVDFEVENTGASTVPVSIVLRSRTSRADVSRSVRWNPDADCLSFGLSRGESALGSVSIAQGLYFALALEKSPEAVDCTDAAYVAEEFSRKSKERCHPYFWSRNGRAVAYLRYPAFELEPGGKYEVSLGIVASEGNEQQAITDAARLRDRLRNHKTNALNTQEKWNQSLETLTAEVSPGSLRKVLLSAVVLRQHIAANNRGVPCFVRYRAGSMKTRVQDVATMVSAVAQFEPDEAEAILTGLLSEQRLRPGFGGMESTVTPPFTAWAAWETFTRTQNERWLSSVYELEAEAFRKMDAYVSESRGDVDFDREEICYRLACQSHWLAKMAMALGEPESGLRWMGAEDRLRDFSGRFSEGVSLRESLRYEGGEEGTDGLSAAIVILESLGREGPCPLSASLL